MKKLFLFSLLSSLFLLISCNNDDGEVIGEITVAPSENFKLLSPFVANTEIADFSNNTEVVTVSASFNEEVSYKIKITRLTSCAERNFTGKGAFIEPTDVQWKGRHEKLNFFRRGEKAVLELSFFRSTMKFYDTVTVDDVYDYIANPLLYSEPEFLNETGPYGNPIFSSFSLDAFRIINESELALKIPQGENAYMIEGDPTEPGGTFSGGVALDFRGNSAYLGLDSENGNEVYFNIYVYGEGQEDSFLQLSITEDDCSINCDQCQRNDLCFDQDVIFHDVDLSHTGWKLISIRYSDFMFSTYGDQPGNRKGNTIYEPDETLIFAFSIFSQDGESKRAIFDFPFFTVGKPFIPEEF